jgi:REP element-mobilizing transposase RayT
MPYNHDIHHRRSIRLKGYDYSQAGLYFVTICVQNMECVFGKIVDEKINLSPLGIIADVLWHEIKNHAHNVDLGEFTVMPNHIHGIIMLLGNDGNDNVGARHALPLRTDQPDQPKQSRFQNQGKNTLSSIVGSYKSAVSKHAHRLGLMFSLINHNQLQLFRTARTRAPNRCPDGCRNDGSRQSRLASYAAAESPASP